MIAYCLLPNHYHFLVHQNTEQAAGKLPQYVFNSYTKAYNQRYSSSGTLFERRYQSKMINSMEHLLHLCRYIHGNPVKHEIVHKIEDWPYTNYLDWIGKRDGKLVDLEFIQQNFGSVLDYTTLLPDYLETFNLPDEIANYVARLE
jgi:putative transposase